MPSFLRMVSIAGLLPVVGCLSPVAGTWTAAPDQPVGKMTFGAMTLAHDGTFTAEAKYDGNTQMMTGWYKFAKNKLTFRTDDTTRTYGAILKGSELTVTHEGTSLRMNRVKGCCGLFGCCCCWGSK